MTDLLPYIPELLYYDHEMTLITRVGFCPSKTGFGRDSGQNLGSNRTKLNIFIKATGDSLVGETIPVSELL